MTSLKPVERAVRARFTSERDRQRFDRAKRFVDEAEQHGKHDELAHRFRARWLKFLCARTHGQREIWPQATEFLLNFATNFGLPEAERREFVNLGLLGQLLRELCFVELVRGPPEFVARLTRVEGWEHFERCRLDGAGLMLMSFHAQFSRLLRPYLRERGHECVKVGVPDNKLEKKGFLTTGAKRFEQARKMHAAKQRLARGGIAYNLPDARQNLDNSRTVEFFGRQRQLAAGFAEVVLATGAHVMPVAYRFSPRGFFVLEFGAPFHVPGPESPHENRVDALVEQYASFLRAEWRRYPWNIHWGHLKHYCELPEAEVQPARASPSAVISSSERLRVSTP